MTSLVFFCVIFFCSKILKKLGGLCCCQLPKCFCSMKLKVCATCMNVACGHTGVFRGATPIKTWDTLFMNTYGNPDIKSLCRVNSKSVMCLGLACRRGCLSQKETLRIEVGFFSDLDIFLEGGGGAEPGMLMGFSDWKSFLDWITQFTSLSMNPWFTFFFLQLLSS